MRKMLASFSQMLFPHICVCCNGYLSGQEKHLCDFCLYTVPKFEQCKDPENRLIKAFWGRIPLQNVIAYLLFKDNNEVQRIIHQIKYKGNRSFCVYMGQRLGDLLKESWTEMDIDFIVPVPLHPSKELQRGYNQSELLADGIAMSLQLPVIKDMVLRNKNSSSQTRKSRFKRHLNTKDIFSVRNGSLFKNKHVLVVDDVITTGATIEACGIVMLEIEGLRLSVCSLAITD